MFSRHSHLGLISLGNLFFRKSIKDVCACVLEISQKASCRLMSKVLGVGRTADVPVSCFLLSLSVLYIGIKESDTGLAPPALWDLAADKQTLQSEQPLQVARWVRFSPLQWSCIVLKM